MQVLRTLNKNANTGEKSDKNPEEVLAMAMTGGYVNWLRNNAIEKFMEVDLDERKLDHLQLIARFVAHMRAIPVQFRCLFAIYPQRGKKGQKYRPVAQKAILNSFPRSNDPGQSS